MKDKEKYVSAFVQGYLTSGIAGWASMAMRWPKPHASAAAVTHGLIRLGRYT